LRQGGIDDKDALKGDIFRLHPPCRANLLSMHQGPSNR
jgi:hypothetical protein